MKRLAAIAGLVAAVASPAFARRPAPGGPSTGLPGLAFDRPVPDVDLDTGGGPVPLHARFGRPVVLVFWASWCGPCVDELAELRAARRLYGERIALLTVSLEEPGVGAAFLHEHDLPLPTAADPDRRIAGRFGVTAIPVTLVLRSDGTLAHVSVGELAAGELTDALAALVTPT